MKLIKRNCEYFISNGEKGEVKVPFFGDSDLGKIPLDKELSSAEFLKAMKISLNRWELKKRDAVFRPLEGERGNGS